MAGLSTVVWNYDGTSWNNDGIMIERWNGDGIITDGGNMDGNSWNRHGNFLPTDISTYYGYLVPICTIELILGNDINSVIHNITGNFKESNLLMMHWNAGPAFLERKLHNIEAIVSDKKPHIIGISEANLRREVDKLEVNIEGYILEYLEALENDEVNLSRLCVYIRSDIKYKRLTNLENRTDAAIWLEIGMNKGRKLYCGQIYREFMQPGQPVIDSGSNEAQMTRWRHITDNWRKCGRKGDTLVMGDMNLHFENWALLSGHQGNLADEINNKIVTEGFTQTVTGETHFGFGSDSLIDLSWNNCSRRHLETLNLSSQSDHNVIMTRMSCKYLDNVNVSE